MGLDRLYLDYNATSPLSDSVKEWLKSGDVVFANPASQHTDGKRSRKIINESRATILKTFHRTDKETSLFFHSGATEAFHTFVYSFSEMARLSQRELLICYSSIDHPAVTELGTCYWGGHVSFYKLKIGKDLNYLHSENILELQKLKAQRPSLIILYHHLWVHNETGFISPLEEISEFRKIPDLYIHVDAVQSPGKIPNWTRIEGADIWSFSAHKFGALKGIGFSFVSKSLPFYPLITGGGQQQGMRSGTENPQGVRSLALALEDLLKVDVAKNQAHREEFENWLKSSLQGMGGVVSSPHKNSNTIYFYFDKLTSDLSIALFDLHGLELSAGSACSSGSAKDSLILLQKGLGSVAKNGIRLSWGFQIEELEIQKIKIIFQTVLNKIKSQ